jgi:hypothetical protein
MQPRIKIRTVEVDGIRNLLRAVPAKDRTPQDITKSQAVRQLLPDILELQERGHDLEDIARLLSENGLPVSMWTVRNILVEAAEPIAPQGGGESHATSRAPRSRPLQTARAPSRPRAASGRVGHPIEPSGTAVKEGVDTTGANPRGASLSAEPSAVESETQSTNRYESQYARKGSMPRATPASARAGEEVAQAETLAPTAAGAPEQEESEGVAVALREASGPKPSPEPLPGPAAGGIAAGGETRSTSTLSPGPEGEGATAPQGASRVHSPAVAAQDAQSKAVRRSAFVVRPDSDRI